MTAMQAAFERAGFSTREAGLLRALAQYINNGGTIDRAHELVDYAASQNAGKGHRGRAEQGHLTPAQSRHPNGDGVGHLLAAREGQPVAARPSPAGQGHTRTAVKAADAMPAPRPMSPARRDALMRTGQQRVRTFWDTEIGSAKRRLGSLTRFDIRQVVRRGMIDVHIGNRLLTEVAWPDDDQTPLERIADSKHVKRIVESAADALEGHHG